MTTDLRGMTMTLQELDQKALRWDDDVQSIDELLSTTSVLTLLRAS